VQVNPGRFSTRTRRKPIAAHLGRCVTLVAASARVAAYPSSRHGRCAGRRRLRCGLRWRRVRAAGADAVRRSPPRRRSSRRSRASARLSHQAYSERSISRRMFSKRTSAASLVAPLRRSASAAARRSSNPSRGICCRGRAGRGRRTRACGPLRPRGENGVSLASGLVFLPRTEPSPWAQRWQPRRARGRRRASRVSLVIPPGNEDVGGTPARPVPLTANRLERPTTHERTVNRAIPSSRRGLR
jgi:hypothetical protein